MILKNIKDKQKGFTIVELLVVIVVIGILAAITIVSYTGITARAKLASAQQTVNNIVSKAEVYAQDGTTFLYPASLSALTGAAASTTYYLSGVTFSGTLLAAAPTEPDTINFWKCGHSGTTTAPTTLATITNVTGAKIGYWNYNSTGVLYTNIGNVGTAVGTYPVTCFMTTTE